MLAHYVQKPQKISSKNASELGIFKTRKGYLETYEMGCLKLTYHQDFLHVRTETALEKSDHETALPQGKKYAGKENCIDYYPFGLTFNSYQRENSVPNKWKFQGQEHVDDLGLNWDSFKWRNHQPDIGRFFNIDPLASKYVYNSPYAFSENRVINGRELEGLEWVNSTGQQIYVPKTTDGKGGYTEHATATDRRLGNSLQGTTTGKQQFSKLVNSKSPIAITLNEAPGITYNDEQSKKEGKPQLGKTDPHVQTELNTDTGKSEVSVEKSEITINLGSIKATEKGGDFSGEDVTGIGVEDLKGWNERIGFYHYTHLIHKDRIFGPRTFAEFNFRKGFALRGEVETMNTFVPPLIATSVAVDPTNRQWVWGVFGGIKKEYKLSKTLRGNIQMMYNFHDRFFKTSPYADRLNVRMGFEFLMKKKVVQSR
jgi:RHS repeat-associated protein